MHGVVSRTGGTDAGVLPKYKNDIKKYLLIDINNWVLLIKTIYQTNLINISLELLNDLCIFIIEG